MESVMTKIILISFSLLTIALLFYAYTRTYNTYSEVRDMVQRINNNRLNKELQEMYCFFNSTSGNVEVHIFNYGSGDEEHKLSIYYESGGDFEKMYDAITYFTAQTMTIVQFNPPDTPPSEFDVILIWVDTGEIESVGCVGS